MRRLIGQFNLVLVRLIRYRLLLVSIRKVFALKLPFKYATFSLLPEMHRAVYEPHVSSKTCESKLSKSVDVIISLYKFEKYEKILRASLMSCFSNSKVTFHFVVVNGTETELSIISSIVGDSHHKMYTPKNRIGIYPAWNLAIQSGTGELITNLNADDLRLPHSICQQASGLEKSDCEGSFGNFVLTDDIFSYLEPKSSAGIVSNLGEFNSDTLLFRSQNFMHCAPMWRRSLHYELGYFDESLISSGDTEFWLRAMTSGARFSSYPSTTVIYFHNPEGLSTSLSSIGHKEWTRIRDKYILAATKLRQ